MSRWKLALVLIFTVICMVWVLWGMDLSHAWGALRGFRLWVLVPVFALSTGTLLVRTVRFRLLLDHPVPYGRVLSVMAVGFLAIGTMPLRLGELVRPYLLYEESDVPLGTSMAAVVLERLLDLLALLVMILLSTLLVDLPPAGLEVGRVDLLDVGRNVVGGAVVLGLVAAVILGAAGPLGVQWLSRRLEIVSGRLAGLVLDLGTTFVEGFRALVRRPLRGLGAVGLTAITWTVMTLACGLTMAGFQDLAPTLDRMVLNWTATMTGMTLLPTPGALGGFEAGSVGSLVVLGVELDLARTFALLMHLNIFVFTLVSGAIGLAWEGWSLVSVIRESGTAREGEIA